ncbi:hypothetical protein FFLO_00471 [Filobasidium floriforme]|uniref:Uncharacterized protein n=1 Tax=Filobasidium floriforme TaxID=5210 RepID=A0A8K0JWB3_9TREE|nr:uncharacterized protein HD553DRAFT_352762 [Filobasidium floriforme]KAG7575307.1 hypothetical protein FFLO_00471 [Filobasidium floriforme]KAH8078900.1 hypothetical protein HD553DRAFT_352762 [Filobasidium floriforme]
MPGAPIPRNPLILTLTLDKASHAFLTNLRSKYFPPSRNFLSAHVTLFHAIPPHRINELNQHLNHICATTGGWDVFIGEPKAMGKRGVLVNVRERPSATVENIHHELLTSLNRGVKSNDDRLTDQDARPLGKPHVTILNKAKDEEQVDKCLQEVLKVFEEMKQPGQKNGQQVGRAIGFELWEYMGGPWKPLKAYWLKGEEQHPENEAAKPPN